MTKGEKLRKVLDKVLWTRNASDEHKDVLVDAIVEELEQEPTNNNNLGVDCISREQVLGLKIHAPIAPVLYSDNSVHYEDIILVRDVEKLPSVTPKQRIGKWIKSRDSYGNNHFTCPFCEHDIATKADTLGDNYCSNCGAKLQESEDKE